LLQEGEYPFNTSPGNTSIKRGRKGRSGGAGAWGKKPKKKRKADRIGVLM